MGIMTFWKIRLSLVAIIFQADQNWLFQQDNAPCHTAHSNTNYFVESNILLMPWPALKPDQKFMELDGLSTNKKANNLS